MVNSSKSSDVTQKLVTEKVNPTIKINPVHNVPGSNVTISANINKNATGNAVFKLNGKTISNKLAVSNGTISFIYTIPSKYSSKDYNLSLVYSGNSEYNSSKVNSVLTIDRFDTTMVLKNVTAKPGQTITLEAIVKNAINSNVVGSKVTFKLNGNTIAKGVTDSSGKAVVNYTVPANFSVKSYTLTAISGSTSQNSKANGTANLILEKLNTVTVINNVTAKPGQNTTFTALVKDENGNNVLSGDIVFKIGDGTIGSTKVINGIATLNYTIPSDWVKRDRVITAVYQPSNNYLASRNDGVLSIIQLNTITTVNKTESKPGHVAIFTALVKDENGNDVLSGDIVFKIGDGTIGSTKVINGIATLNYTIPSTLNAGERIITAVYQGNNKYNPSRNVNTLILNKLLTNTTTSSLNTTPGSVVSISVHVVDEDKLNVTGGSVVFKFNNVTAGTVDVKNGLAVFRYTIPSAWAGLQIKLNTVYSGNNKYSSSEDTENVNVFKLSDVYVSANGSDDNYGTILSPFKTINFALTKVAYSGTVNILQGVYYETLINITQPLRITGAGKDKTIISGQANGNVIMTISKDISAIIYGITFQNAKTSKIDCGAAITNYGLITVNQSSFKVNEANGKNSAGAIYNTGLLNVIGCDFVSNIATTANSEGGAIVSIGNITSILDSTFTSNKVTGNNLTGGAAIYAERLNITISNTTFIKNTALGKEVVGGAIKIYAANLTIYSSSFNQNTVNATVDGFGGAIGNFNSRLTIYNSKFDRNNALGTSISGGGALYNQNSILVIYGTDITNSVATAKAVVGGAMYNYNTYSALENTRFISNNATATNGNALGGAINFNDGSINALNVTISNNRARGINTYGGGIYFVGSLFNITSSYITSNLGKATNASSGGGIFSYSEFIATSVNFQNNQASGKYYGGGAIASTGNLTVTKSNFVSNTASGAGNAIANGGKVKSILNNYWGAKYPTWSNLLYNLSKPSQYSKTAFKI
ncbi:MAG: Ig-like domain repeat protein [Methanobacteriaceae archaeon]|nr:Ig-like domain repeat protein [Methanobacteriaceae archaeon]